MNIQLDRLTLARTDQLRMKSALELARQRAVDSETARHDAEQKHANLVADAMLSGDKTPSKPAALSALQAADAIAASAMAIIESRMRSADGELHSAAADLAIDAIKELVTRRHAGARIAAADLVRAHERMVGQIGIAAARLLLAEVARLPVTDRSNDEIARIAEIASEVPNVAGLYLVESAERRLIPSFDELTTLFKGN